MTKRFTPTDAELKIFFEQVRPSIENGLAKWAATPLRANTGLQRKLRLSRAGVTSPKLGSLQYNEISAVCSHTNSQLGRIPCGGEEKHGAAVQR